MGASQQVVLPLLLRVMSVSPQSPQCGVKPQGGTQAPFFAGRGTGVKALT